MELVQFGRISKSYNKIYDTRTHHIVGCSVGSRQSSVDSAGLYVLSPALKEIQGSSWPMVCVCEWDEKQAKVRAADTDTDIDTKVT